MLSLLLRRFSKTPSLIEASVDVANPALNITELPQDVLAEIFSHLKNVNELMNLRLVSRSFKKASKLKFSWKNIAESMGIEADDFKSFNEEIKVYAKDIITIWKIAEKSIISTNIIQSLSAFFMRAPVEDIQEEQPLEIIKNFDKWIEKNKNKVSALLLSKCSINYLPNSVGNLKALEILNLDSNNLKKLPENIGNLINLKALYLYNNKFKILPDEIWNLNNLENFSVSCNKLEILSENVGKLENLKELYLAGNEFTSIPESILNLPKLKKLVISKELKELDAIKRLAEKEIEIQFC